MSLTIENTFKLGENCRHLKRSNRASFLIDGENYFRAVYEAMEKAEHSIMIVGWDLHSELRLLRNGEKKASPETLGKFLDYLARKKAQLDIYLLSWDFAMIYAMEREFFPRYKLKWRTHKNIHFCLDGEHPVGASQHQKIVVVDDLVAFSGGFDLSKWRWDTSEHRPDDELRIDPDGKRYPPFHDVQMLVDGDAAMALGQIVRERWQRACEDQPKKVETTRNGDPWPESVTPDLSNVTVAISRTLPQHKGHEEIREVEKLYCDTIAKADKYIYIENQYLSSYRICEALEKRLTEEEGPEIIAVLPLQTGGWLEQHTMDVLRGRILQILRQADRYDRLRVYYPRISKKPDVTLMVHAKIMVIDDCFVRIGSSNLSNRSLGLDSECDLAIAVEPNSAPAQAIIAFRNTLLAEHLGVMPEQIKEVISNKKSLISAVESLSGNDRSLCTLQGKIDKDLDQIVPESELLDPEKPIEPEEFFNYLIRPEQQLPAYRHFLKILVMILVVLGLLALWRWTSLENYLNVEAVTDFARVIKEYPFSPVLVPATYILLSLLSFPVTLMIMATIVVYGPWLGGAYALVGVLLSAMTMFFLGNFLGKEFIARFSGSLINRINQRLKESGLMAIIAFRIIPVAPFSIINLIAGVSAIQLKDFFWGTFIGILPGIVAIAMVADRLSKSLRQPDMTSYTALFAVVVVAIGGLAFFKKWIQKRRTQKRRNNGSE